MIRPLITQIVKHTVVTHRTHRSHTITTQVIIQFLMMKFVYHHHHSLACLRFSPRGGLVFLRPSGARRTLSKRKKRLVVIIARTTALTRTVVIVQVVFPRSLIIGVLILIRPRGTVVYKFLPYFLPHVRLAVYGCVSAVALVTKGDIGTRSTVEYRIPNNLNF